MNQKSANRFLAYGGVYTVLEVLAVPAVPLTMTAGIIFGPIPGTIIVSIASTAAATLAFLIARYAARDKAHSLHPLCESPCPVSGISFLGRDCIKAEKLILLHWRYVGSGGNHQNLLTQLYY